MFFFIKAGDTAKDIALKNGFKDIAQMIPDASTFIGSPKKVIICLLFIYFFFFSTFLRRATGLTRSRRSVTHA